MLETNIQQQQDRVSQQLPPESRSMVEAGLTVICTICEAVYAPSPLQALFLQSTREALEATFMSTCHFCFRCRRAACPQCWDDVHGVCGSCVQEARLPFRVQAAPVDGLLFPPTLEQLPLSQQEQQNSSLFVTVRHGRFYVEARARTSQTETDIDTAPTSAVQLSAAQIVTSDNTMTNGEKSGTPAASAMSISAKSPLPAVLHDTSKQEKKLRKAKAAKKVNRLELVLTWVLLVIVLVLVVVIALAEYIPAVNALVARGTHIDIHAEIAYLVHIVQQRFKK